MVRESVSRKGRSVSVARPNRYWPGRVYCKS